MKNRFVPERVKSFSAEKNWKVIAGGQHHTLAVDKDGKWKLPSLNRVCSIVRLLL